MNKQEAAALLEVSVRTLETYVAQNRLPVRYIKGKTRRVSDFDEADVERLKAELSVGVPRSGASPGVQKVANLEESRNPAENPETSQEGRPTPAPPQQSGGTPGTELARFLPSEPSKSVVVIEAAHLQELLQAAGAGNSATSQSPQNLASKMLLTLAETQTLTGLSRDTLKQAIGDGLLPAKQMGRAWRLRPEDVRDWLRASFDAK